MEEVNKLFTLITFFQYWYVAFWIWTLFSISFSTTFRFGRFVTSFYLFIYQHIWEGDTRNGCYKLKNSKQNLHKAWGLHLSFVTHVYTQQYKLCRDYSLLWCLCCWRWQSYNYNSFLFFFHLKMHLFTHSTLWVIFYYSLLLIVLKLCINKRC